MFSLSSIESFPNREFGIIKLFSEIIGSKFVFSAEEENCAIGGKVTSIEMYDGYLTLMVSNKNYKGRKLLFIRPVKPSVDFGGGVEVILYFGSSETLNCQEVKGRLVFK